ncbi:hypothetical protein ACFL0V_06735 [Nanoarchaeota archaeon]
MKYKELSEIVRTGYLHEKSDIQLAVPHYVGERLGRLTAIHQEMGNEGLAKVYSDMAMAMRALRNFRYVWQRQAPMNDWKQAINFGLFVEEDTFLSEQVYIMLLAELVYGNINRKGHAKETQEDLCLDRGLLEMTGLEASRE